MPSKNRTRSRSSATRRNQSGRKDRAVFNREQAHYFTAAVFALVLAVAGIVYLNTSHAAIIQKLRLCNPGGTLCLSTNPTVLHTQVSLKAAANNNSQDLSVFPISGTYNGNPEYKIMWDSQSVCAGIENNDTVETDTCGVKGTAWTRTGNNTSGYKYVNVAASQLHGSNYYLTGVVNAPVTVIGPLTGSIQTWKLQ